MGKHVHGTRILAGRADSGLKFVAEKLCDHFAAGGAPRRPRNKLGFCQRKFCRRPPIAYFHIIHLNLRIQ
jgi:hypothetical protein